MQAFPLKGNLKKKTLSRCLLAGKKRHRDTCTLHKRKYRSVILITMKNLNMGADRFDPDQTAPNFEQGLHCFAIPPASFTGICIYCNKKVIYDNRLII